MEQIDIKLSPQGDVVIDGKDIVMIKGREIQIQAFRQLLQTRLTEYFLNLNEGLDFDVFLGRKEINEEEAIAALYAVGLQIEDFVKFTSVKFDYDQASRKLKIEIEVLFKDGYNENIEMEVSLGG